MEYVLLVFSSLTTANKIKTEIEKKYSIKSRVMQTPKNVPVKSCSYCLRILYKDAEKVWNFVKSYDVYTKGVYSEKNYNRIY